jgi:hypothetical protein
MCKRCAAWEVQSLRLCEPHSYSERLLQQRMAAAPANVKAD